MSKLNQKQIKKQLLERRYKIEQSFATNTNARDTVELDQSRVGRLSRIDARQNQEMSKAIDVRRQNELSRIENALLRLESEDFGYCIHCGEAIAFKRLKQDPTVLACINCSSH